jgi:hypothetical protein
MAKVSKLAKRVSRVAFAPSPRKVAPVIKLKKKPRGAPFKKGNRYGLATRFRKGEPSPNPEGRPSLKKLNDACRDRLARIVPREELAAAGLPRQLFGMTYAEMNAWVMQQEGLRGNISAIAEIGDRAEGRPGTSLTVNEGQDSISILIASMNYRSDAIGPAEGSVRVLPSGEDEEAS